MNPASSRRTLARGALLALGATGVIWLAYAMGAELPAWLAWLDGLGPWGPAIFIVIYALGVLLWLPGSLLTLTAGALFDLLPGTVYVFVGATLGSSLAFLAARYLARAPVERWLERSGRFAAFDRGLGSQGFRIVFLMRLSPAFPFTPLNFVLGLTAVRFRDYLAASFGMIPATVLYVYYGKLAGDVAQIAAGEAPMRDATSWGVLASGLVVTLAVTLILHRAARRALAEAEEETPRGTEP